MLGLNFGGLVLGGNRVDDGWGGGLFFFSVAFPADLIYPTVMYVCMYICSFLTLWGVEIFFGGMGLTMQKLCLW